MYKLSMLSVKGVVFSLRVKFMQRRIFHRGHWVHAVCGCEHAMLALAFEVRDPSDRAIVCSSLLIELDAAKLPLLKVHAADIAQRSNALFHNNPRLHALLDATHH